MLRREDRPSPLLLAEHVSTGEGTGVVHTAPGHGAEDFAVGMEHGIEIYNPVGPDGVFLDGTPGYAGVHVWEANPRIVEDLEDRGLLLDASDVVHAYPHCWRCKNPVIFRATIQWFLALDHAGLRTRALEEPTMIRSPFFAFPCAALFAIGCGAQPDQQPLGASPAQAAAGPA